MVRTVERIEQELAVLDRSLETIAQEFRDTYSQYLTALGQSVRQQLILAAYYLCTQGYPERFLNLSLSQRQQLQQSLRQLAQQSQQQFLEMLNGSQWIEEESPRRSMSASALFELSKLALSESNLNGNADIVFLETDLSDEELAAMDLSATDLSATDLSGSELLDDSPNSNPSEDNSPEATSAPESNSTSQPDRQAFNAEATNPEAPDPQSAEVPTVAEIFQESVPSQPEEALTSENQTQESQTQESQTQLEQAQPETVQPQEPQQPHPKLLARWQERLEEKIVEELQSLSHSVNRLLQQAEILPGRLPEPVLEVAARADLASETAASPPNLLNLVIETETEEPKESTMTQLMAIRLRLSEIEFSDSATMAWRSKVRELLAKLNKLGREYQKKQKERSIAEAEAAWRSSWYEEKE
jgi:hypothetical protein